MVIRGGSRPGKAANKERERELQAELLHRQYFAAYPLYDETTFRRRYRVSSSVYKKIKTEAMSMQMAVVVVHKVGRCADALCSSCLMKILTTFRSPIVGGHLDGTGAISLR